MTAPGEMLRRLLRQAALLVLLAVLGLVGGGAYALLKAPTYTAKAHVVVIATEQGDDATAVKFAQAYGRIATESVVLARTSAAARGASAGELRRSVRVATSPDAPLVELTGTGRSAQDAANVANDLSSALIGFGNGRSGQTHVRLAAFAEASPPDEPSSPNLPLDLVVGAAAGLLVGGLAVMAGVGGSASRRAKEGTAQSPVGTRSMPPDVAEFLEPRAHGPDGSPVQAPGSRQ